MKHKKQWKHRNWISTGHSGRWISGVLVLALVLGLMPNVPLKAGHTGSTVVTKTAASIDTSMIASSNQDNAHEGVWTPFTDTGEYHDDWTKWETETENSSGYNYARIEEEGGKEDTGVLHVKRGNQYEQIGVAINAGMTKGETYTLKAWVKSYEATPNTYSLMLYQAGTPVLASLGDSIPNDGTWREASLEFSAQGQGIYLWLHANNGATDVYVDNIKVLDSNGNDMLNGAGNFYIETEKSIVEIPTTIDTSRIASSNQDNAHEGVWTPFTDTGEYHDDWTKWETETENSSGYNYARIEEEGGKEDTGVLHFKRGNQYEQIGVAINAGMTPGETYTLKAWVKSYEATPSVYSLMLYQAGTPVLASLGDSIPNDGTWREASLEFSAQGQGIYLWLHANNGATDVYVDNIKVLDSNGNDMLNGAGNFCTKAEIPTVKKMATIDTSRIASSNQDSAHEGVWTPFTDTGEYHDDWTKWETENENSSGYNYARIEEEGGKEDTGVLHVKRGNQYEHIGIAINAGMTPGETYTLKAWVKSYEATPNIYSLMLYQAGTPVLASLGDSIPNDGTWREASLEFSAQGQGIYLWLHANNGATDVYVDNIKVLDSNGNDMLNGAGNFYSEALAQEYEFYEDISTYRTADKTHPTKAGYVFAGWYKDAACTKALPEETTTGEAYAKFVDEEVLAVKAQIGADTTANSDTADIRFVSTVDSTDYKEVGFEITIEGREKKTIPLTIVYKQLFAVGSDSIDKLVPSETFSIISEYFYTYAYWRVPNEDFAKKFTVTPYWITKDGTTVYGTQTDKTVSEGIDALAMNESKF